MISKWTIKRWAGAFPKLYLAFLKHKRRGHWSQNWIVDRESELVIEGFPRSGNSFALSAFKKANPSLRRIATHVHAPSQVEMALHYGIPCLVLIRNPEDAVHSLIALSIQIGDLSLADKAAVRRRLKREFQYYDHFYRRIIGRDHSRFYFARFESVTKDFGQVIQRFNAFTRSTFTPFDHSAAAVESIFASAPTHLGPRSDRDAIKEFVLSVSRDPRFDGLKAKAAQTYEACLGIERSQQSMVADIHDLK